MSDRTCLTIVLAAGEGTRMRSALPKAMHKVGGLPLVGHALNAAAAGGATSLAVVVGPQMDALRTFVAAAASRAAVFEQTERRGTAHAVLAAKPAFAAPSDDVVVLYADTPLLTAETIGRMRARLAAGADLVVLGFRPGDATGYGRLLMHSERLLAIREERDATPEERKIDLCNAGVLAFRGGILGPTLDQIGNSNAKNEFYLTDAVGILTREKGHVAVVEADADEVAGVNSRRELAHVEGIFQRRMREAAMAAGVTMIAPSTVWLSHDTVLGSDVTLEPNVFFGPGVRVADSVTIRANSHIEGAEIASGAVVGPFARLRPGTAIGPDVHIGNFVEVKNGKIDEGAKINHLTYMGDAHVGARANIGAGTIACNYDGVDKHHTEIGAGAFIGSNSALVAPVTVGEGSYVASGSVITHDVPPNALAVARGKQVDKPEWARNFREMKARGKPRPPGKSR
jgi:bifunctional UDP-N-acetylglucosamine pyrophosphorylase/glucosamine-1-phosphate N-acetyltransferase